MTDELTAATKHLHVFDAIFDGITPDGPGYNRWMRESLASSGCVRLFGNANIGMAELTNTQVAGQITYGTAWITNWYARTNIPYCQELVDWSMSTNVRLQIGYSSTALELSLFDLFKRAQLADPTKELAEQQPPLAVRADDRCYEIESAGRRALEAFQAITGTRLGFLDLPTATQREAWLNVGKVMLETFKFPPVVVVPIRQNFSVAIDGNADAFRALQRHVAAVGEGERVEVDQPDPIMPRARAWVHFEGFIIPRDDKVL